MDGWMDTQDVPSSDGSVHSDSCQSPLHVHRVVCSFTQSREQLVCLWMRSEALKDRARAHVDARRHTHARTIVKVRDAALRAATAACVCAAAGRSRVEDRHSRPLSSIGVVGVVVVVSVAPDLTAVASSEGRVCVCHNHCRFAIHLRALLWSQCLESTSMRNYTNGSKCKKLLGFY